jgi:predicted unusual protein kinase regulating ubiquinone biosynthesis (AarF/ABC1/UbiB family)
MNEQISIPTSKVQRASKFMKTGARIGGNYVKYYARKTFNGETNRDALHEDNARDIYDSLSELKGSALKAAQMMSMDKNILPRAYSSKFSMSQYSAPPLSYPLVVKTFQKTLGKSPTELFDTFTRKATNAASIGQVHRATANGKHLAVKVQYPGVAESVGSDLKMVKPLAMRIMNISEGEFNLYMEEVKDRLLEETDYNLELERSIEISEACAKEVGNIYFPKYYKEFSTEKIITMDWIEGEHLKEFLETDPSQEIRDKIGQTLWDFYDFQVHQLKMVHADPHPGNFLFKPDGQVGIIDFGCVKVIPNDFYENYFKLYDPAVLDDESKMTELFYKNEFITDQDTPREKELFIPLFKEIITLLGKPFIEGYFDFGDDAFFKRIYTLSDEIYKNKEVRNSKTARGSRHGLYINRTYFGLYTMLNDLKARVNTRTRSEIKQEKEMTVVSG